MAQGLRENGIAVGNTYDKYGTRNPISRQLTRNFGANLAALVKQAAPSTIHEVGCGEGYWVLTWARQGYSARGSDFSEQVVELARSNAQAQGIAAGFAARSIYDLDPSVDDADLLVCCEVLEHLEDPEAGLQALSRIVKGHVILSVPREPLWRAMNMARARYLSRLGNTPGHLNHWSRERFVEDVSRHFDVVERRSPLPWTMLLCRARAGR